MASSSSYSSPCAACKFLRRKCMPGCIFAPYFPPEEPQKFANVHKIFGASNVNKLLNELLPHQREDAVNSLAYEAEARVRDPVYGCVGAISYLQRQVQRLQKELDAANADLVRFTACNDVVPMMQPPPAGANFPLSHVLHHPSLGLIANPSLHHIHGRNRSMSSSSVNDYFINNQNGRIHHHHAVAASAGSTNNTEAAANHNHNNNNTGFYRQYSGTTTTNNNNNNNNNNYLVPYTIPWADTTTTSDHGINEGAGGAQGGGGNL